MPARVHRAIVRRVSWINAIDGPFQCHLYCADYRCSQVSDRETDESIQAGHRSVAMRRDRVRRGISYPATLAAVRHWTRGRRYRSVLAAVSYERPVAGLLPSNWSEKHRDPWPSSLRRYAHPPYPTAAGHGRIRAEKRCGATYKMRLAVKLDGREDIRSLGVIG